ncbi:hypothetical protein EC9_06110 [Rosistilla ulvae]|uniref:Uncharacterized protein n=1 Tax=Rosistilla ulvae TaxID=1930277 RepID=A0A517LV12_9BACT|nr:hypothetical protein EC9_06110 [Rosistilla ulvae]
MPPRIPTGHHTGCHWLCQCLRNEALNVAQACNPTNVTQEHLQTQVTRAQPVPPTNPTGHHTGCHWLCQCLRNEALDVAQACNPTNIIQEHLQTQIARAQPVPPHNPNWSPHRVPLAMPVLQERSPQRYTNLQSDQRHPKAPSASDNTGIAHATHNPNRLPRVPLAMPVPQERSPDASQATDNDLSKLRSRIARA